MTAHDHEGKTIHLAADHAGVAHKASVFTWLCDRGGVVVDHGAIAVDDLDDFPDFIAKAAAAVSADSAHHCAIVFGGSGQGEAMVANRFPHVRATVFYGGDETIITLSREHNDANVLSIGARFVDEETTKRAINAWLTTSFAGEEKRVRRNQKIERVTKTL